MKESVKKVEKAHKEDYTKLLPLFIYTDNTTAKQYYADFDKSIKKSSSVIQRHCITDKKKKEIPNACKWIDENYMLIGESHFYKRDLFSALEAFEYCAKIYPNPEAKYSAMLWMMRTDNEIGSYSLTEGIMDDLRNATDLPKKKEFQKNYKLITADYYIKRGDYASAIRDLTSALPLTKKKSIRARYTYIIAQLYEKINDTKSASKYYGLVAGLHGSYDLEFSAKINHARLFDTESGNINDIKKELTKMLKDDKNIDYRDQIYFAFANLAIKENDVPQALDYLNKSIRSSTSNKTQLALSYLKRADIQFDKPDYRSAEANYDSTISVLPKDYPDYILIDEKRKSLTSLVLNLKIIEMEDSLQRLTKMSEKDRNAAIDNMIAKLEEEEKRKDEEKQNKIDDAKSSKIATGGAQTNDAGATAWYFYNPTTISFGASEFIKKWGSRKLEDNWRREDKDQIMNSNNGEEALDSVDSKEGLANKNGKNKKDRNYYLKRIPFSSDALAKSNLKIVDAYYNAGFIYKEQILNNKKSTETLEELLSRFPESKYKLQCYYALYRTFLIMKNQTKADYYKNIILSNYPDTEYAKIILNPDFAKNLVASKSEVEKFYTQTYQLYEETKYSEALANCTKAENEYSKNYLMPQFIFLKALCVGRTQDVNAFESALSQVVIKFPKDAVKDKAQEILDAIKKQKDSGTTIADHSQDSLNLAKAQDSIQSRPVSKFNFNEDAEYYYVTIVENGKGNILNYKEKLSDANTESFSLLNLNVSSVFLDITHQLISVKTFNGNEKAMNYYNFFKDGPEIFSDLVEGTYQSFIISAENYSVFYKDKNIEEYKVFFTQYYQ